MGCGTSQATTTATEPQPNTQSNSHTVGSNAKAEQTKPIQANGNSSVKRHSTPSANGIHAPQERTPVNNKESLVITKDDRNATSNENNQEPSRTERPGSVAEEATAVPSEAPSEENRGTSQATPADEEEEDPTPKAAANQEHSLPHKESIAVVDDSLPHTEGDTQEENSLPHTEGATLVEDHAGSRNVLEGSPVGSQRITEGSVNSLDQPRRSSSVRDHSVPAPSEYNLTEQTKGDSVPSTTDAGQTQENSVPAVHEDTSVPESKDTPDSSVPSTAVAMSTNQTNERSNSLTRSDETTGSDCCVKQPAPSEGVVAPGEGGGVVTPGEGSAGDRICTVSASVVMPSLDGSLNDRNVTLTGSVYRVSKTPDPVVNGTSSSGDKIGFITGHITSAPKNTQEGEKIASIRGDLLAATEDAKSAGKIAYASVDVISCTSGENVAIITANVCPDSESPDESSAVISGEVIAVSKNGTADERIGTVEGRVVALVFQEGVFEISSEED